MSGVMMSATDDQIATQLLGLGAATLGESGARPMRSRIKAVWPGARVAAPAFTALCAADDNLAIHVAVAEAPAGSVIVAELPGTPELGCWGEVLTTGAQARGLTGLVIEGGVRDVAALEALGFPVFAAMIALPGAAKINPGTIGGSVTVGGALVETGDWIVGDVDGVVAVPRGELEAVIAAGRARADKETAMFDALRSGSTTVELLGLDATKITRA